jgi:hypothetical protein
MRYERLDQHQSLKKFRRYQGHDGESLRNPNEAMVMSNHDRFARTNDAHFQAIFGLTVGHDQGWLA